MFTLPGNQMQRPLSIKPSETGSYNFFKYAYLGIILSLKRPMDLTTNNDLGPDTRTTATPHFPYPRGAIINKIKIVCLINVLIEGLGPVT